MGAEKLSYFKFFAYFVKKYDAHDAASGVGTDGAADHRLHQLSGADAVQKERLCIGKGIRILSVADAHDRGSRIRDVLLHIFHKGFQLFLAAADGF